MNYDEDRIDNNPSNESDSTISQYLKKLQSGIKTNETPSAYRNGTFWIYPNQAFFALRKKVSPTALYLPRVFLWLPHLLVDIKNIKCPSCKNSLSVKGWNEKPSARRVVDVDRYVSFNKQLTANRPLFLLIATYIVLAASTSCRIVTAVDHVPQPSMVMMIASWSSFLDTSKPSFRLF